MADSKINELINHGKQNGKLTTKEITDVLEELDFDADEINKLYDDFENSNIEIVDDFSADEDLTAHLTLQTVTILSPLFHLRVSL